jgi:TolA-binding protein
LKQDDEALNYLKLSFTDKDSIGYYSAYYLGSIYLKKQQKPMALTSFDIARKFKSDARLVEESSFQFAKIAYELGNAGLAISEFESILKQYPNSSYTSEIKELLSQAYVNASNYNKAIEYIESLPKRSASVNRAYQKATMLKGLDFFNKEQFTEAIQFFDKSIHYPVDQDYLAEASFWNGESYSILKQHEQAIGSYQKIIALTGYDNIGILSKTRYGLGYCFFNLQQYDRALFNFKEFVNKASSNQQNLGDGLLRLADCYYVAKEYNEALKNYQKAISIKSADSDYAHLQSGVVMGILRNYSESAAEFEVVIKSSTQIRFIEEAIFQRAQLNFEQGNYASAVAGYTKLLSTYPSSRFTPYSYTRRAAANYNLKEYNKTADDYITVLSRYPSHPANKDVLLPLQEALNLAGRSAEFDNYLAQYKSSNPDAKGIESVDFETAKNLYYNQDYSKAILRLGDYISQYPSSSRVNEANYYLAESYFRTKDVPKALGIYYLIQQDKAFLFANKVTGRIAELEFKQGNYDKAVFQYAHLSKVATNKKEQFAAWNGQLESYFLLAQYDSAKSYAEIILTNGSANATLASKATLYLGKIAKEKGDYETAKDEFLNTINSAHDEHGAEANYLMGELFYLTKQHSQCYTTLVSLNANFASYPEWVGKSYLLLSDNFIATNDIFNARAVLKSLVDNFPLENIKLIAKERLIKMDQAENKKQEKVKADTVDHEK